MNFCKSICDDTAVPVEDHWAVRLDLVPAHSTLNSSSLKADLFDSDVEKMASQANFGDQCLGYDDFAEIV